MFNDATGNVNPPLGGTQSWSTSSGESSPPRSPFRVAYDTTRYEERELEFYNHAVSGAFAAGYKVTNSIDEDKVRRALEKNPNLLLLNSISLKSDDPKANWVFTSNPVDAAAVFGTGKEVALKFGKGVSTSSQTSVFGRCFVEIDDRPKDQQADLVDRLHDAYGLPYPSDGVDSGTAYGFFQDDTDTSMVAGKSLHLGWNTTPASREDWTFCQTGLITMFESDTACIAPSWRMRIGGVHAKYAGDLLMEKTRRQRWFWKDPHLDTELAELKAGITRWAGETGTDIPARFEALKWLPKLKGCCTVLSRRADAAFAAGSTFDASTINTTKGYVTKEMDRLSRGGMPTGDTEKLYRHAYSMGGEYDPKTNAKSVKSRKLVVPVDRISTCDSGVSCDGGRETDREPDVPGVCENDGAQPGTGYLDAGWDLETEVFLVKDGSELVSGTFSELYEVYGDKQRTMVTRVMCRLCGKAGRETNSSAAICYHPNSGTATFTCCACGQKQKSASPHGCKAGGSVVVKPLSYRKKRSHVHEKKAKTRYTGQLKQLTQAVGKKAEVTDLTSSTFVPDDLDVTRRVMFMALPQGKGKTEWLARWAAKHPDAKVLVIVPTMNLADSAYGRLAPHGFDLYSEQTGGDLDNPRLVTCIDSVPRIMDGQRFDLLVLEEAHSTFSRMNDAGMRNRNYVWTRLKRLCRDAGHVVAMDAGLTTTDIGTVCTLAGTTSGEDMQLVYAKAKRNKVVKEYDRFEDMLLDLPHLTGPTMVYCTTLSDAKTIFSTLPADSRKLLVGRPTSGEDEVIELMRNPNALVTKYDFLVFTPSGNSGIDISVEHFKHVLVVARAGTFTDPWSVLQGMWRVRHCEDVRLWVQDANVGAHDDPAYHRYVIQKQVDAEIAKATVEGAKASEKYEFLMFVPEPADKDFIERRIQMNCERARGQNNLRGYVRGMLKEQGVILVKQAKAPRKVRREVHEEYSERKEAVRQIEYRKKADALPITQEEAGKLERKRRVTEEQRRQVYRAKMVDVLGDDVEITRELVDEWDRRDLKAKVHRFAGVEAYLAGNGAEYARSRYRTYSDDRTRAETGNVMEVSAMSRVLREVYGIVSLLDLPETIEPLDAEHLEVLKQLMDDPEVTSGLAFHENAGEKPLRFLQNLLGRVGIGTKSEREQVDGVRRYYLVVTEAHASRMGRLTAKQRHRYEPLADPEWVMNVSVMVGSDDCVAATEVPTKKPGTLGGIEALVHMALEAEVARQTGKVNWTMSQQIGHGMTMGLY